MKRMRRMGMAEARRWQRAAGVGALITLATIVPAGAGVRQWTLSNDQWYPTTALEGDFGHGMALYTAGGLPNAMALINSTGVYEYLGFTPTGYSIATSSGRDIVSDDRRNGSRLFLVDDRGVTEYLWDTTTWNPVSIVAAGPGFTAGAVGNDQDRFWAVQGGTVCEYTRAAGGNTWSAGQTFSGNYVDVTVRSACPTAVVFLLRDTGLDEIEGNRIVRTHNNLFSGATGIATWSDQDNIFVSATGGLLHLLRTTAPGSKSLQFESANVRLVDPAGPYLDVICETENTIGPISVYGLTPAATFNYPAIKGDGDLNFDGDVDAEDLGGFLACLSGEGVPRSADCLESDMDRDGDVDLGDFGLLQACMSGQDLPSPCTPPLLGWREYVLQHLDNLLEYGTDRYGPVETPLLMSIIDVHDRISPPNPLLLDGNVRCEGRPQRRNPRGSNLWYDQATIRALYRCGQLTNKSRYAKAADDYIAYTLAHAVKPNGMLVWGSHIFYDAYADQAGGDANGPHETLILHPIWDDLWRIDPVATRREIEGIWTWHIVDKATGEFNRHDDASRGCDFAFAGGEFALAFAYLYTKTGDTTWLNRSKLVVNWHWRHRNTTTLLIPDAPIVAGRYDSNHCFTTIPGPYASLLLRCYQLTQDPFFRDMAVSHLKAYDRYAYDAPMNDYWAMLALDGTPVPQQPKGPGYDAVMPSGPIDVWRTLIYSYEFAEIAAQSCMLGYELCGDPELLTAARRWAAVIEANLPAKVGRRWYDELTAALPLVAKTGGTYAENYGRVISFYVHLYLATYDPHHLGIAKQLGREAARKLFVNGMFKGHPAKPYYESTDGVGMLLQAFLELDAVPQRLFGAF